jgi:hypothetical protein
MLWLSSNSSEYERTAEVDRVLHRQGRKESKRLARNRLRNPVMVFWHLARAIPSEDHFAEYHKLGVWMRLRISAHRVGNPGRLASGSRSQDIATLATLRRFVAACSL